jgi:serine/threonine-protein kinase SRPK3
MKPVWLNSLKKYYANQPEKLKHITGSDSYCVQLLNCFLHHGPHGKHFVMVFEILGVNLLEVIKRYNYKGTPLHLVRIMAK